MVLTGDIHSSWAIDLTRDPMAQTYDPATGAGSLGVELVTPGITSPGFPAGLAAVADGIKEDNRHMKLVELVSRGYSVLDVDQSRVEAAWYHMADITTVNDDERLGGVFTANDGENFLVEQAEPTPEPDAPAPAP